MLTVILDAAKADCSSDIWVVGIKCSSANELNGNFSSLIAFRPEQSNAGVLQ